MVELVLKRLNLRELEGLEKLHKEWDLCDLIALLVVVDSLDMWLQLLPPLHSLLLRVIYHLLHLHGDLPADAIQVVGPFVPKVQDLSAC